MKALLVIPLLLLVALAGCSGPSGPVTPTTDAQGRYVIHLTSSNHFSPQDAKVPLNATVVWVNDGGVHDVTEHMGAWSSDDITGGGLGHKMQAGDSYVHTFAAAGTIEYHCSIHESTGMKGSLVVG
jgi:plastocyanin